DGKAVGSGREHGARAAALLGERDVGRHAIVAEPDGPLDVALARPLEPGNYEAMLVSSTPGQPPSAPAVLVRLTAAP
ncbi:MAG TPA: hypothetical protein VIK61_06170, partial [Acidimicrobiia bacterium]